MGSHSIVPPAMRPIDVIPLEHEGQPMVLLRDPEGICDERLALPILAFFIVSCFNGTNTVLDIQAAFQRQFGQLVQSEDILALLKQFDEFGLLQNERYTEKRRRIEEEYAALPARPASHAGQAYPDDPEALKQEFEGYFEAEGGAGPRDGAVSDKEIVGLVSPHMDPRCSGPCASWAMKAMAASPAPDLFVIFGTAHQPQPNLFSLSDKDYDTPLGRVLCDMDFIAATRRAFGAERLEGELIHRTEHSIEFQVVFLHALYGGSPAPFKIVPILCGSFHEMIESGQSPSENPELAEFCDALRAAAATSGKRVCFVAGADLAHMGMKFGDDIELDDLTVASVRRRDLEMLEQCARGDAEGFFNNIQKEKDARKICGLPPMYTMMQCIGPKEGKLLRYDYDLDPETKAMVSFCSMAFYA